MTQYINKNEVENILRKLWKEDDGHNAEHRICYNKALEEVQYELDNLEVKKEILDKKSMAVDRFEAELKPQYKDEYKFWDDYFKARDEYYNENE